MKTLSTRLRGQFSHTNEWVGTTTRSSRLSNTPGIARSTFRPAMMSWVSPSHGYQVELAGQDNFKIFPLDVKQGLAHTFHIRTNEGCTSRRQNKLKAFPQPNVTTNVFPPPPLPNSLEFKAQSLMQKWCMYQVELCVSFLSVPLMLMTLWNNFGNRKSIWS